MKLPSPTGTNRDRRLWAGLGTAGALAAGGLLQAAGAEDKLTPPSHARRIAEMLPELRRLTVLEDTGHMAPLERPDVVTDALAELVTVTAERGLA